MIDNQFIFTAALSISLAFLVNTGECVLITSFDFPESYKR